MSMRLRWWGLVVAILALAVAAPPALAAFPGANGQLVLTPAHGSGILIASARTGRAHRVCDAPQSCQARPTDLRLAPNGREVVFRDAGGRLVVSSTTGTCIFCVNSVRLWNVHGTSPAFTPAGTQVTYVHHGLWEVTPGSPRPTRLRVVAVPVTGGPVSAAIWSPSGKPAVVRRGWLWTGIRKGDTVILVTRLARGAAPAWSPDGRNLAFIRGGSVFMLRVRSHRITRIARGSAPAFSPDGRALAYLNPSHQVAIRTLNYGATRTRTLTRLRGRSLDWQPVTAITRRGCAAANGVVVASNGAATIRAAVDARQERISWNGCLDAVGVPFHLNGGFTGTEATVALAHTALHGAYAALQFVSSDSEGDHASTVNVYDLRSGALVRNGAVQCDGVPCDLTGLTVNAAGFAGWHAYDTPRQPESDLGSLSCPSASLCVGSDSSGDLLISTDPAGGRSAWTALPPALHSAWPGHVSCPTVSFCLGTDTSGHIITSTDPAGGARAWQVLPGNPALFSAGISCATPTLCAAINGLTVFTSTDPTGPSGAWHATPLTAPGDILTGASCPSTTLCLVVTSKGEVVVSQDPGDAAPTWTPPTTLPGQTGDTFVTGLNCPSTGFCAAAALSPSGSGNSILTTTDPAGGAATWSAHPLPGAQWVTCPSTALCVAFTNQSVATSTDPTDPSPTWSTTALPGNQVTSGICPTTSLCIGARGPSAAVSQNPTGGADAWSSFLVAALPCDPATPCRAEVLQAVDDRGTHTFDTAPQGSGTVISDPTLAGNTLTWTDQGAPRSAGLS